jgi:hypothetical protein
MNDKMREAEASVSEVVRMIEEAALEARETGSRHADAIAVLARLAEALRDATQDVAEWVNAETIGAEDASG